MQLSFDRLELFSQFAIDSIVDGRLGVVGMGNLFHHPSGISSRHESRLQV